MFLGLAYKVYKRKKWPKDGEGGEGREALNKLSNLQKNDQLDLCSQLFTHHACSKGRTLPHSFDVDLTMSLSLSNGILAGGMQVKILNVFVWFVSPLELMPSTLIRKCLGAMFFKFLLGYMWTRSLRHHYRHIQPEDIFQIVWDKDFKDPKVPRASIVIHMKVGILSAFQVCFVMSHPNCSFIAKKEMYIKPKLSRSLPHDLRTVTQRQHLKMKSGKNIEKCLNSPIKEDIENLL